MEGFTEEVASLQDTVKSWMARGHLIMNRTGLEPH